MKRLWPGFLATFEGVPQSLEELIELNNVHADIEFTERLLPHGSCLETN